MRTNIVLNDELVARAIEISGIETKKKLIDTALKEFVRNHSRLDLRDIRGKINFREEYDHKKMREGK